MEEKVTMEFERHQIFVLFNNLLIRKKSILKSFNNECEELLKMLWEEADNYSKTEALRNKGFRSKLEYWNISYEEDLIKLDIPKTLEDDE